MKIYASFSQFSKTAFGISKIELPETVTLILPEGYGLRPDFYGTGLEVIRDGQPDDEPAEIIVKEKGGYAVSDSRIDPTTGDCRGYITLARA